jgi:hypothetical protein
MQLTPFKSKVLIAPLGIACLLQTACFNSPFNPSDRVDIPIEKSKVEISADNVADGITPAQISMWLRTAKGTPIVGAQSNITASGTGAVIVPCTISDHVGFTRCKLYSTSAGKMIISVSGPVTLNFEIDFAVPKKIQGSFGVVVGSSMAITNSGNKIIATSGIVEAPINQKDTAGRDRLHSSLLSTIIND